MSIEHSYHHNQPNPPFLSIVIPVFNEEKRIKPSLEKILAYLETKPFSREFVLVDDGSIDRGIELASSLLEGREKYRVVSYGANRGKGYALQQGMLAGEGDFILFTDADLATPVEELDKILPWFEPNPEDLNGFAIVQGSRKMPGAYIEKHQPWLRENMGKMFTWLCNQIADTGVSDITCGFKCYRREVAHDLYSVMKLTDWSFDAEVIFIARKRGYSIKEVPVRWHDIRGTKVRLVRDSYRSMLGLLQIRKNHWSGIYKKAPLQRNVESTPIQKF